MLNLAGNRVAKNWERRRTEIYSAHQFAEKWTFIVYSWLICKTNVKYINVVHFKMSYFDTTWSVPQFKLFNIKATHKIFKPQRNSAHSAFSQMRSFSFWDIPLNISGSHIVIVHIVTVMKEIKRFSYSLTHWCSVIQIQWLCQTRLGLRRGLTSWMAGLFVFLRTMGWEVGVNPDPRTSPALNPSP